MKLLLVTLATCLALHSTSSQANPVSNGAMNGGCQNGWTKYNGKCYKVFGQTIPKQSDAYSKCENEEAIIVTIKSKEENEFLKNLVNEARSSKELASNNIDVWLGARRENISAPFFWSSGEMVNFTDWEQGEPKDNWKGVALCLQTYRNNQDDWKWGAISCGGGDDDNAVVCQKKSNPVNQAGPENNGAMEVSNIGMALEDLHHFLEIKTNLTRVQQAQIEVLHRLQQHQMELNKEKLAAKQTLVDLHVAEIAKLSNILKETQEFNEEKLAAKDTMIALHVAEIAKLSNILNKTQELNKEKLAAKDTMIALHVAQNAKLPNILKETHEFCDLRSISAELKEQQNEVSKPGCDVGEMYDGNCYLLVSSNATWKDARLDCISRNGSLASIDNAGTNDFIANLAGGGNSRTWIGGSDAETEGEWKWTNGNIPTFYNWRRGQPDNWHGIQNCLVINYRETGKWDDYQCKGTYPYVCQGKKLTGNANL